MMLNFVDINIDDIIHDITGNGILVMSRGYEKIILNGKKVHYISIIENLMDDIDVRIAKTDDISNCKYLGTRFVYALTKKNFIIICFKNSASDKSQNKSFIAFTTAGDLKQYQFYFAINHINDLPAMIDGHLSILHLDKDKVYSNFPFNDNKFLTDIKELIKQAKSQMFLFDLE